MVNKPFLLHTLSILFPSLPQLYFLKPYRFLQCIQLSGTYANTSLQVRFQCSLTVLSFKSCVTLQKDYFTVFSHFSIYQPFLLLPLLSAYDCIIYSFHLKNRRTQKRISVLFHHDVHKVSCLGNYVQNLSFCYGWVISALHNGQRFYLCTGSHNVWTT